MDLIFDLLKSQNENNVRVYKNINIYRQTPLPEPHIEIHDYSLNRRLRKRPADTHTVIDTVIKIPQIFTLTNEGLI